MFANLLAATLASNRDREDCTRIDCDMFTGARCASGSRIRCRGFVDATDEAERGSAPARGWLGGGEIGVDVCAVPPSGPWGGGDEEDEGPATGGPKVEGVGFTNMD